MNHRTCGTTYGTQVHAYFGEPNCEACKHARTIANHGYRKRRTKTGGRTTVDAVGVHRRLRALARMGWSWAKLGELMDLGGRGAVPAVMRRKRVHVDTHRKIVRMYEALCMSTGGNVQVMRRAVRLGWPGPLDWDDIDNPLEEPFWQHLERRYYRAEYLRRTQRARERGLAA